MPKITKIGSAVVQANFNMMDVRALDSGLLAEAERRGAGFVGRTPLCFGFLSGTITRDAVFPPGTGLPARSPWPTDRCGSAPKVPRSSVR